MKPTYSNGMHPTRWTWREALEEKLDEEALARVRLHLSRGRPLGGDKWIARLESRLGRRLRPLPVGRPRKKKVRKKRS